MATEYRVGDSVILRKPPAGLRWKETSHAPNTIGEVRFTNESGNLLIYSNGQSWNYRPDAVELLEEVPMNQPRRFTKGDQVYHDFYGPGVVKAVDDARSISSRPYYVQFAAIDEWVADESLHFDYSTDMEGDDDIIPVAPANPKQAYGDKKVPLHLVPPAATIYAAIGLREGAEKYGAWNFRESKVEVMTYIGAIQRHLAAWVDGQDIDTDSLYPKPHLAGAMASLCILIDALETGQAIDNRPANSNAAPNLLERYKLP